MAEILIKPHPLEGKINAPPSKSAAHRALILAALSERECTVEGVAPSADMAATLGALKGLGFAIEYRDGKAHFTGKRHTGGTPVVNCGESGSTLRFMVPVAAALGIDAEFTGEGRLPSRPISIYKEILDGRGVEVTLSDGRLPLQIRGKLKSGTFLLPGHISSQFVTGLLLALPFLDGDSEIILITPLESTPYVDITLEVMTSFGLSVRKTNHSYRIKGRQHARADRFIVEGDFSQAAFWLCAGALGGPVSVGNLDPHSVQGDKAVIQLLSRFGADVSLSGGFCTARRGTLSGIDIDASQIPDLVPALSAVAAYCKGRTRIYKAARLRDKESDRIAATADFLEALGADVWTTPDGLVLDGKPRLKGGTCSSHGDHRIAMAAAVAAAYTDNGAKLTGCECVKKSYPGFFQDFIQLGGVADGLDMG
ncbi:MAG: 3-phosphoshikimate 1-carboxyvinyltransferase [Bacillota bacterium]|nr:3-phosphoshikimate 1-carboxyvinyltransferase [Bacillota bacterium]